MTTTISATIHTNRTAIHHAFPAKWIICQCCAGNGVSSSYLGAYTASEWNDQDDEFRENYMRGSYDKRCDTCSGLGRVRVLDTRSVKGWRSKVLLKAYLEQQRDNHYIDAIEAAERRAGA